MASQQVIVLYRLFSVTFLIMGTACNLMSALVYSRKHMRQTSFAVYLLALAIVDLLVTWTGNIRFILMFFDFGLFSNSQSPFGWHLNGGFDLRETSITLCRLHTFFTYYLLQLSSGILCMLNIDRFVGCVLVLRSSSCCKASVARRCIISMAIIFFVANAHFFVDTGYFAPGHDGRIVLCQSNPNNTHYTRFWHAYVWIDSILYSILPFFIMIFCNFVIIRRIVRSRVRSGSIIVLPKTTTIETTVIRRQSETSVKQVTQLLPSERRTSFILLGVSISFLVLTFPVTLMETVLNDGLALSRSSFTFGIANMLMYMNHVINFFFYCLIGAKFRTELRRSFPFKYLPKRRNKINPNMVTLGANTLNAKRTRFRRIKMLDLPYKFTPTSTSFENPRRYLPNTHIFANGANPFVTTEILDCDRKSSYL
jgi:hypothetical protein